MSPDLTTTNTFLGIIAVVSALQGLAVIGACFAGFVIYRHVLRVVDGVEQRQVAPTVARVNAILDDVQGVTAVVRKETGRASGRVDHRRPQPPAAWDAGSAADTSDVAKSTSGV